MRDLSTGHPDIGNNTPTQLEGGGEGGGGVLGTNFDWIGTNIPPPLKGGVLQVRVMGR